MVGGYMPAGYSESESDSDWNEGPVAETKPVKEAEASWLVKSINRCNKEDDFDVDIKQVLDEGDEELLAELLDIAGVNVNHRLVSAHNWSLALYCASKADHKLLRWLLRRGGLMCNKGDNFTGYLVLSLVDPRVVSEEKIQKTAEIIKSAGENMNKQQDQGRTALMLASSYGNITLVRFLCEEGADMNLRDSQGWSALMFAADSGHGEIVRHLLDKGADPNFVSVDGQTAADIASMHRSEVLQKVIEQFSKEKGLAWTTDGSSEVQQPTSEMDSILLGLDLEEYKDAFKKHKIGLEEFLVISDEDLTEIGVEKVGARRRLLEAQVETHKKTWGKTSMPRLKLADSHAGLRLTCQDTAEVLGNLSKHVSFLKASVAYIRLQLRDHGPRLMQVGSDVVSTSQLIDSIKTCRTKILDLEKECRFLRTEVELHGGTQSGLPADSISRRRGNYPRLRLFLWSMSPVFVLVLVGLKLM